MRYCKISKFLLANEDAKAIALHCVFSEDSQANKRGLVSTFSSHIKLLST